MAKVRYAVQCTKHGKEGKDWAGKQVMVPRPNNKAQRFRLGCPECRAAAVAESKAMKD